MAGNQAPIYSRVGDIQGSVVLTTAANDYTGNNVNNTIVYQADPVNGGFVQRLRFKALGTNAATVARIYINEGYPATNTSALVPGTPTVTVNSGAGSGALQAGSYYSVVQAIDQYGIPTQFSAESTVATATSNTANLVITWAGSTGANTYRLFVGPTPGGEIIYFQTTSNTTTYTVANLVPNLVTNTPAQGQPKDFTSVNMLYGEISLPATTSSTSSATVDVDYPMNLALPPGYHILVGLGSSVVAGWTVTTIAGKY